MQTKCCFVLNFFCIYIIAYAYSIVYIVKCNFNYYWFYYIDTHVRCTQIFMIIIQCTVISFNLCHSMCVHLFFELTKYDQNRAIGIEQRFQEQHQTIGKDDCLRLRILWHLCFGIEKPFCSNELDLKLKEGPNVSDKSDKIDFTWRSTEPTTCFWNLKVVTT